MINDPAPRHRERGPRTKSRQIPIGRAGLTHRHLESIEEIAAVRPIWEDWVARRYAGNPFWSLDWHLVWLKHFASEAVETRYVEICDRSGAVAYFPMIVVRERFRGMTIRVLRYAGNVYSPVNGPLLGTDDYAAIFDYFVQNVLPEIRWQLFRGDDLPPEYPGATELQQALIRTGCAAYLEAGEANWIYEGGAATPEDFHRLLGANLRSDTRRFARKLEAAGDFQFRLVSAELTPGEINDYLQVYSRSWKVPEKDPTFHPELMEVMARRGQLRLGLLYLDGIPIATQLWLVSNGCGYIVKLAYDEAYSQFKAGTVLTWRLIERLIADDGMTFFDYLKGDDDYKKRWAPVRRERLALVAFPVNTVGRVLHALDRQLIPWARRNPLVSRAKNWLSARRGAGEGAQR